jgi:hypothetical protein
MPAQIATTDDLKELKKEIIESIARILKEQSGQAPKKWLKSPEVKKLLGISHGTLQTLRINGTIPYTRIGGTLYYEYADIQKILEGNKAQNQL